MNCQRAALADGFRLDGCITRARRFFCEAESDAGTLERVGISAAINTPAKRARWSAEYGSGLTLNIALLRLRRARFAVPVRIYYRRASAWM